MMISRPKLDKRIARNPELPDLPSALIRLAMKDLREVEADPRYAVDMEDWHQPNGIMNVCQVCLAGSIMAKTFQTNPEQSFRAVQFEDEWKLASLDYFRCGGITDGLEALNIPSETVPIENRHIVPYTVDRERFHEQMEELAHEFAEFGL